MDNNVRVALLNRICRIGSCLLISAMEMSMLSGCGAKTMQTSTLFAMDTVMELQILGDEKLLLEGENQIRTLEKELSVTDDDSEVAHLNASGRQELSDDVADLMDEALGICDSTEGALDITIYPVLKAWGFTTSEYKVPTDDEIAELLQNVDYRGVMLDNNRCQIPEGTQVDLGSVAKGYTARTLYEYFTENGVTSGLINLGGNVQCIGSKPNGEAWNVAVKSPFKDSASGILGVLRASDEAVVTSGGYERYFEKDGKTYWHIIDPATGRPAENGLISVTIIGRDGLLCDGLSTALFVKGLDGAVEYYHEHGEDSEANAFDMILVTADSEVYVTKGVADRFSLSSEYYDLNIHNIN